jgi:hypothetical protein
MPNDYEQRQEARRERLRDRANRARAEADAAFGRADDIAHAIPMGQPILVGHHSEKRHRADLRRMDSGMRKGIAKSNEAAELDRRAERVGSGGVSSDDPEAIAKLRAKLAKREAAQDQMKAINAAWRKAGKPQSDDTEAWAEIARAVGCDIGQLSRIRLEMARDFMQRAPYSYHLTNNNGNIRRIRQRIEQLERSAATPQADDITGDGWRIEDDAEENRIRVWFDAKPPAEIRAIVKRHGFRWAPSVGAWQRKRATAGHIAEALRRALTAQGGQ